MGAQVARVSKFFTTNRTSIRLFVCVGSHMPCEGRTAPEALFALITLKRPFVRVHAHMIGHLPACLERRAAYFALERGFSGMDTQVDLQVALLTEGFLTICALVRLFASVLAHMHY